MGNFKIGDKVVPKSKSVGTPLEKSVELEKASEKNQKFLYVNSFEEGRVLCHSKEVDYQSGDYFLKEDLTLYKTKPSKKQRIETLEKEVSELKLIVHELRERKPSVFTTLVGQDLEAEYAEQVKDEPSTDISVEDKQADVIEFEGQQYRKVEREAVEGDVVIFRENTSEVSSINKPYKVIKEITEPMFVGDIGNSYTVYNRSFNRTPETVDVYEPITQPVQRQTVPCSAQTDKTPNELRAEVIEKAKAFFEANGGNEFVFSVDENKRTAFCWKLVSNGCGYNTIHGLSTCHPNDVFNEHIGKAIALGRALGLDVSEFEQVVQPSEVVVGTYTHQFQNGKFSFEHTVIDEEDAKETNVEQNHCGWTFKIINDTNAIYGGVE